MTYAAIIRDEGITFIIDGKPVQVKRTDAIYDKVKTAHTAGDHGEIKRLLDVGAGLITFANGSINITEGLVSWNGEEIDNSITRRMIRMMHEGFSIEPMIMFLDNLMDNPSKRAVDELYMFLEQNELPISADGMFLAYKKVNIDYTDTYTRSIDNSVGQKPSMRRNQVQDNRDVTCSTGFHFCSKSYLNQYGANGDGARVMILKVNPRDVVSIPSDYNNAKGRCCKYEVVGEWNEWYENFKANKELLEGSVVNTDFDTTVLKAEIEALVAEIPFLTGKERRNAMKRLRRRIAKLAVVEDQQVADAMDDFDGDDEGVCCDNECVDDDDADDTYGGET